MSISPARVLRAWRSLKSNYYIRLQIWWHAFRCPVEDYSCLFNTQFVYLHLCVSTCDYATYLKSYSSVSRWRQSPAQKLISHLYQRVAFASSFDIFNLLPWKISLTIADNSAHEIHEIYFRHLVNKVESVSIEAELKEALIHHSSCIFNL